MWPLLRYLLFNTLHRLLIGKAGDDEAISHNLHHGFAILVDEMSQVQSIFLVGNLHRFFPIAFTLPALRRMPDEDGVGMRHQFAF
jgi:hypothetical protein